MQLSLEQAEVQLILNALASQPYANVFQLIPKIVGQANAAAAPQPEEAPNGKAD